VLGKLIEQDFIRQQQGNRDRRQRLLFLTEQGAALERQLSAVQQARVARAYRQAGAEAVAGYRKVLQGLIDESVREQVIASINRR
jgi:DNA-binding MarR family transcriptional regulator